MIGKIRRIWRKNLGSILVPVFLILPISSSIQVADSIPVQITFEIKNTSDNSVVMNDYGLQSQPLFANIFKAKTSSQVFSAMQKDHRISFVTIDQKMKAAAITTTTDPFFTADSLVQDKQWYLAKTHIPEAWQYTKGSSSVIVAVVDTGIHASHVELNDGRIIAGYNAVSNKPIAANANSDDNGHGTAVAGVIGAIPNNQAGISGINWNISIMPIKALAADGTGDTSAVATGIVWAVDHGANIINLSLGGAALSADPILISSITYAYNKGALIVSAAGNDQTDHGLNLDTSPIYPICADTALNMILGVAATDENDQKAIFSNYGKNCVDIAAPGKHIITSAFFPSDPSNNVLIYGSGTSVAAPMVSGIAALLKSINNNLSNVEIRNTILRTADNIDFINQTTCAGFSCAGLIGTGRINALTALAPPPLVNGSLIRQSSTGNIYILLNNSKQLVSDFVFAQRGFGTSSVTTERDNQLVGFPTGAPLPPMEGTLIKGKDQLQVYVIEGQMKRPLTYLVFISRGYKFANVQVLAQSEVDLYQAGDWYWPPDGTMVLVKGDATVYVMDHQVRRAVTYFVFTQRRLSFTKVINVTNDEFSHVPKPQDQYWLAPLEGTLVKSNTDPGIYMIENSTKRLLSGQAFTSRGFSFSSVKTLPAAEMDVIAPGSVIL